MVITISTKIWNIETLFMNASPSALWPLTQVDIQYLFIEWINDPPEMT